MKTVRASRGPFQKRPFYEQHEIERTCLDELSAVGLLPDKPEPVRIDYFIEKRFKVVPEYQSLPAGVLGYSRFGGNGVEAIVISGALDSDPAKSSERRLRTTLAHEAGHVLFQGHLFALGKKPVSLFNDGLDEPRILCRAEDPSIPEGRKYDGKWWEFQADQAIGPLLLPQPLVELAIEQFFAKTGSFGLKTLPVESRESAAAILAEAFNVNPAAARTRLNILYPVGNQNQLTL